MFNLKIDKSVIWDCLGNVLITSYIKSLSIFSSASSINPIFNLVVLFLSASSPATLNKSNALLASPCSLAAYAAHLLITPSSMIFF